MMRCPFCNHLLQAGATRCANCDADVPSLLEAGHESLEDAMTALIRKGETAAAITVYRERTNSGLKEAEDAVKALAHGEHLPKPNSILTTVDQDVVSLVREGKRLDAIKLYRAKTGVGLAEAKQAVTDLAKEYGIQSRGSGCFGVLVSVLAMVIVAYFMW